MQKHGWKYRCRPNKGVAQLWIYLSTIQLLIRVSHNWAWRRHRVLLWVIFFTHCRTYRWLFNNHTHFPQIRKKIELLPAQTSPGYYDNNGQIEPCPIGEYSVRSYATHIYALANTQILQTGYNAVRCEECPSNYTTLYEAATRESDCFCTFIALTLS